MQTLHTQEDWTEICSEDRQQEVRAHRLLTARQPTSSSSRQEQGHISEHESTVLFYKAMIWPGIQHALIRMASLSDGVKQMNVNSCSRTWLFLLAAAQKIGSKFELRLQCCTTIPLGD